MKTIITVEDGKVTVQIDDQAPAVVHTTPAPIQELPKSPSLDKPAPPPEAPTDAPRKYQRGQTTEQKKAKTAEYNRRWRNKKIAQEKGLPVPAGDVEWCKKCQAFTTHNTQSHSEPSKGVVMSKPAPLNPGPDFMPGHEKSAEEISTWNPQPILPGQPAYGPAPRDDREAGRT